MEGQELIQTNENDEEMEIVNKKSMTLEESIDNLEAENIKLCNEVFFYYMFFLGGRHFRKSFYHGHYK